MKSSSINLSKYLLTLLFWFSVAGLWGQVTPPLQTPGMQIPQMYNLSPKNWDTPGGTSDCPTCTLPTPVITRTVSVNIPQLETNRGVFSSTLGNLYTAAPYGYIAQSQKYGTALMYTFNNAPHWWTMSTSCTTGCTTNDGKAPYDIDLTNQACRMTTTGVVSTTVPSSGGYVSANGDCPLIEFLAKFMETVCHTSTIPATPLTGVCDIRFYEMWNEFNVQMFWSDTNLHLAHMADDESIWVKKFCGDCYFIVGSASAGGDGYQPAETHSAQFEQALQNILADIRARDANFQPDAVSYHRYPSRTGATPEPFPESIQQFPGLNITTSTPAAYSSTTAYTAGQVATTGSGTNVQSNPSIMWLAKVNTTNNNPTTDNGVHWQQLGIGTSLLCLSSTPSSNCRHATKDMPTFLRSYLTANLSWLNSNIPLWDTEDGWNTNMNMILDFVPYSVTSGGVTVTHNVAGPITNLQRQAYLARFMLFEADPYNSPNEPVHFWYQTDDVCWGTLVGFWTGSNQNACGTYEWTTPALQPPGATYTELVSWLMGGTFLNAISNVSGDVWAVNIKEANGNTAQIVWNTNWLQSESYTTNYLKMTTLDGNNPTDILGGSVTITNRPELLEGVQTTTLGHGNPNRTRRVR